jgi:putative hydrolase of the HAD superfamily
MPSSPVLPLPYRNLIFDLGGVLINLDTQRTVHAFAGLAGVPPLELMQRLNEPFFNAFEKGEISEAEFRSRLREALGLSCTDEAIDQAWNAMLLDIPPTRLFLLQRLAVYHRLFLLSNTNGIHYRCFQAQVKNTFGDESLQVYFERAYFSHELKMRKPDAEIYEYVLADAGIQPAETLFLDDNETNLAGARRVGIQTFHVHYPDAIFELFHPSKHPGP